MKSKINLKQTGLKIKKAMPTILSVIAALGVPATAYLSAKAAVKATKLVEEGKKNEDMTDISKAELLAINIKYGWKPFIGVALTAAGTIVCIFSSNSLNKKQQATLMSAYMMLESQFREYRNKVVEIHGEEEDEKIITEIVKSKMEPISEYDDIRTFSLPYWDSYFEATTAEIAMAMQRLNYEMLLEGYVTLYDVFKQFGLDVDNQDHIPSGYESVGWSDNYLMSYLGVLPVLEYGFYDRYDEDKNMVIREIDFVCDPTFEAIDMCENPSNY